MLAESLVEDKIDNIIRLAIAKQEQRPRPDVERLLQAAENALRREDPANAINLLRQAVRADLNDLLARVKLGVLLKEQGGNGMKRWNTLRRQLSLPMVTQTLGGRKE